MENNKNKTLWIVLGAVVIIVILIAIFSGKKEEAVPADTNPVAVVDSVEDTTEGSVNVSSGGTTTQPQQLTYQQAIKTYEGKRIQFDATCQATPFNMTYKDGTYLMLDNRSPETRTIKIGTPYTIKGYSFKIVKLANVSKATSLGVDCDARQNVATVLVQQ